MSLLMKTFLLTKILLALVVAGIFLTMDASPQAQTKPASPATKYADLTDRYTDEIASAFLDGLIGELIKDPTLKGMIITYGPDGDQPGSGVFLLGTVRTYTEKHGMDPNRIIGIYGGHSDSLAKAGMELWVVPLGAKLPTPTKHTIDLDHFVGLVGNGGGATGIDLGYEMDDLGPGQGPVVSAAFAEIMRHQPDALGFIVAYQQSGEAPNTWRHFAQFEMDQIKSYGVPEKRIRVIHGGSNNEDRVQFWVQPSSMPQPVPEAPPDRLSDKAVAIGSYFADQMEEAKNQKLAFSRVTELLNDFPNSRICFVIFPQSEVNLQNNKREEESEVDINDLVQKWRIELISQFNIAPDRIVILFAPATGNASGDMLQSWIVPQGANLPDPTKVDDPDDDPDKPTPSR